MAENKDTTVLIRAIRDQSKGAYKVISGGKHLKVIHAEGSKKGRSVLDDNGPVILSGSPSEGRNRELAVHRLIGAGILKFDPWKGDKNKPDGPGKQVSREDEFEARQARRLAVADAHQRINDESDQCRARLERFFVKIGGGSEKRGFKTELTKTICKFLEEKHPELKIQEDSFYPEIVKITRGQTVSANQIKRINKFLDYFENSMTPRQEYFDMVRAAQGIKQMPKAVIAQRSNAHGEVVKTVTDNGHVSEVPPSVFDFVNLAQIHERSGLKWSMGLDIDEYAKLQRAVGFLEAVILRDYGERGEQALDTLFNFLNKMAEARFYSMVDREEAKD